ncbi:MAG: TetR family transcriptional regulator C-terminal domain-containing protein [Rhodobacteraceae bacterium]|nr:TetR family transcriptional regulator C-terminal domain-containing protein [Paracoccaceae bacterium]
MVNKSVRGIQSRNRVEVTARILSAAEQVFAEYGYSGASISRIAATAGIPKSNVIYYFETKQALYRRVVGEIFDVWRDAADTITIDSDPLDALGGYIDTKLELARTRPFGSKVWANEIIQRAPIVQDYLEDELRAWTDDKIAVIQTWIDNGQMREVSPRHLLYAIWASTQHYADFVHQVKTLNDGSDFSDVQWQETKAAVKDILLRGVGSGGS